MYMCDCTTLYSASVHGRGCILYCRIPFIGHTLFTTCAYKCMCLLTRVYNSCFLLHEGRYCEAEAFKKAMGKLMASFKRDDVERLITCLYSDDIIDKSVRDQLRSPMSYHSELVVVNNVLCHLENIIQKRPQVYGELIDILTDKLHLPSPGAILRKCSCLCLVNL